MKYPAVVSLLLLLAMGCDTTPGPSLYDESRAFMPDPTITSIQPEGEWLAGIGTVTIMGENFSDTPAENIVYFDAQRAQVISATSTQLVVASPNLAKSGINVRVAVVGAEKLSNSMSYTLQPAIREFGGIGDFEETFAIATDDEYNLYASIAANDVPQGIVRIFEDGTREVFSSAAFRWDAIEFGPGGHLYGVRNSGIIFRFPPDGGEPENWTSTSDRSIRFTALSIDAAGTVWAGGRGGVVFAANLAGELTGYEVGGTIRALEAHGGVLYVMLLLDGEYIIMRYPINNGALSDGELFFNLTEASQGSAVGMSLAATADGALFVGSSADDPLFIVEPDGSYEIFYPGLIAPPAFSLAWGEGATLYLSRTDLPENPGRILSIYTQRDGP